MELSALIILGLFTLFGGLLYRWRGHASDYKKYFPRPFNQIVFAAPYAVATLGMGWIWSGIVLVVTTLGVLTGHGKGLDVGRIPNAGVEDETVEFAIKWLQPKISEFWYDVLLLSVTGLAVTLPAGLVLLNPVLALSGFGKGPMYALGYKIFDWMPKETRFVYKKGEPDPIGSYEAIKAFPKHFDEGAALGEFFTGLWMYAFLGLTLLSLYAII